MDGRVPALTGRLWRAAAAALAGAALLTGAAATSPVAALAAHAPATPLLPAAGPYFGPVLDWTTDSAAGYAQRLGARPAVYGQTVHYPLGSADERYLRQFVAQVAGQGALALLDIEPTEPLKTLDAADARTLAAQLADLHRKYGTAFYVRFATEMNGSWNPWGQHPRLYRESFRTVAAAVHAALPRRWAAMVWEPVYGAGYPFRSAVGRVPQAGPAVSQPLDTNGDGVVTDADDPYRPYWPGDSAVDWVGLSAYDYGRARRHDDNRVPGPGRYLSELAGHLRYHDAHGQGRDFVRVWAAGHHKPMMVETAALYDPSAGGPSAERVKRSWWRQVLSPRAQRRYPQIRMIVWLEKRRREPEAGGRLIDWRATATPAIAAALHTDLRQARVTLGPVFPVEGAASAGAPAATGSAAAAPAGSGSAAPAGSGSAAPAESAGAASARAADPSHQNGLPPTLWAAIAFSVAVLLIAAVFRRRSRRSRDPSRAAPGR